MKKTALIFVVLLACIIGFLIFKSYKNVKVLEFDYEISQHDYIQVIKPQPEQIIESPLVLSGKVSGSWLFEGTAPVTLTNWNGLIIAEGYIQAEGEWMTTDFVPFTGSFEFETPENIGDFSNLGHIIFHKNNPSDKWELDDAYEFTIRYW